MKRYIPLSALSVAAVIALTGCGGENASAPSSAPEITTTAQPGETAAAEHNEADVMFARMMIPHHRQAVEMSNIMLAKDSVSAEITDLATRIKEAQEPEIDTMTGWLEAWGEPVEMSGMEGHDMGGMEGSMQGMMSEDQLAELEAAQGEEASRMFLTSMTAHHEGAVEMAQHEIANGQNRQAIALAEMIVETQQAEIEEMRALLAGL